MGGPKILNLALSLGIVMVVTLFFLATTTTMAAPSRSPSRPVCNGERVSATVLSQNEKAVTTFVNFMVANVNNLLKGRYDPLLHAQLIDCGCGKLKDTRSPKNMKAALDTFCKRKKFAHNFETFVRYIVLEMSRQSYYGTQLDPTSLANQQIANMHQNTGMLGSIG